MIFLVMLTPILASGSNVIVYIIVGVIVVVLLVLLAVFIMARMKGKLELALSKGGYAPGEILNGELKLTTKKEIEGNRLFVALVAYEEIERERRDSDGGSKTETDRREIHRQELDLLGAEAVPAGTEKSFPFQMETPGGPEAAAAADSKLGKAMGAVASGLNMLSSNRRKVIWKVEARFDCKGIDLTTSKRVTISGNW